MISHLTSFIALSDIQTERTFKLASKKGILIHNYVKACLLFNVHANKNSREIELLVNFLADAPAIWRIAEILCKIQVGKTIKYYSLLLRKFYPIEVFSPHSEIFTYFCWWVMNKSGEN